MPIPKPTVETGTEDIQNIDADISGLYNKFIQPIESLRSISKSIGTANPSKQALEENKLARVAGRFENIQISNEKPLESRCHAFYRMLGFPVATKDGSYYNPGFDPNIGSAEEKRTNVDTKFESDTTVKNLINIRETLPNDLRQIFVRQDINSSVYALVLRHTKNFNNLGAGKQPFDDDPQTFTVPDRDRDMQEFSSNNSVLKDSIENARSFLSNTPVGANLSNGKHILKPFIVDPKIDSTVMPDKNRVAVPFLPSKKSIKIENNVYLLRPGIELIIRERLRAQQEDKNFLADLQKILSNSTERINTNSIDRATLTSILTALADDNNIDNADLTELFQGFTSVQVQNAANLIKTMKVVIKKLNEAVREIDNARKKINWFPVPSIDGPETGAKGASISSAGVNLSSEVTSVIAELKIRKLNAERKVTEATDLGNFASPFSINITGEKISDYDSQLKKEIGKRDRIGSNALKAMGEIEIIMGEVSGLGLIDILAIYTALWTIDIDTLLGFLDTDAFNRLVDFNPELVTGEVQLRSEGISPSISTTLSKFEQRLFNILNFADKLVDGKRASPLDDPGGTI